MEILCIFFSERESEDKQVHWTHVDDDDDDDEVLLMYSNQCANGRLSG